MPDNAAIHTSDNKHKANKNTLKLTCIYAENGETPTNILAGSFAIFLANQVEKRFNEANGWLLNGGTICTRK